MNTDNSAIFDARPARATLVGHAQSWSSSASGAPPEKSSLLTFRIGTGHAVVDLIFQNSGPDLFPAGTKMVRISGRGLGLAGAEAPLPGEAEVGEVGAGEFFGVQFCFSPLGGSLEDEVDHSSDVSVWGLDFPSMGCTTMPLVCFVRGG